MIPRAHFRVERLARPLIDSSSTRKVLQLLFKGSMLLPEKVPNRTTLSNRLLAKMSLRPIWIVKAFFVSLYVFYIYKIGTGSPSKLKTPIDSSSLPGLY